MILDVALLNWLPTGREAGNDTRFPKRRFVLMQKKGRLCRPLLIRLSVNV
jgi:hypothetical protein